MPARRQVTLPEHLCVQAERQFGARFESLEQFIEFALGELVRNDPEVLDKAEQDVLEKRLKDLGYL